MNSLDKTCEPLKWNTTDSMFFELHDKQNSYIKSVLPENEFKQYKITLPVKLSNPYVKEVEFVVSWSGINGLTTSVSRYFLRSTELQKIGMGLAKVYKHFKFSTVNDDASEPDADKSGFLMIQLSSNNSSPSITQTSTSELSTSHSTGIAFKSIESNQKNTDNKRIDGSGKQGVGITDDERVDVTGESEAEFSGSQSKPQVIVEGSAQNQKHPQCIVQSTKYSATSDEGRSQNADIPSNDSLMQTGYNQQTASNSTRPNESIAQGLTDKFVAIELTKDNLSKARAAFNDIEQQADKGKALRLALSQLCPEGLTEPELIKPEFITARNFLISLIHKNLELTESTLPFFQLLLTSYRLENAQAPPKLVEIITSSTEQCFEDVLMSQYMYPHNFKSLFEVYCKQKVAKNNAILSRVLINPSLSDDIKVLALNHMLTYFSTMTGDLLFNADYFGKSARLSLFKRLSIQNKRKLFTEIYHGKKHIQLIGDELFSRREDSRKEQSTKPLIEIARRVNRNEKASLNTLLDTYFDLELLKQLSLQNAISLKLLAKCEQLDSIPLADWDGSENWLLAKAVIRNFKPVEPEESVE